MYECFSFNLFKKNTSFICYTFEFISYKYYTDIYSENLTKYLKQ